MRLLFITALLLSSVSICAQDYTVSDRKAIKYYEVALQSYNQKDHDAALRKLEDAIAIEPDFVEAHLLSFETHIEKKDYDRAEESLIQALTINPDFYKNGHYYYAEFKLTKGDYTTAKVAYEKFISYRQVNPNLLEDAERKLANCKFAISAMENPVPFNPQNMGPEVNSEWPEYFPSFTADGKTLIMTRRIPDGVNRLGQEDFFSSAKQGEHWLKMNPMDAINTPANEGAPFISPDGQLFFFVSCATNDANEYPAGRKGMGSCDIFYSYKTGDEQWSRPENLGPSVNSYHWESQPSFSSDGRTLYFVRGKKIRGGSAKNQDIWVSRLDDFGTWTKAEKLSDVINTPKHESSVLIHPDDQTLYFTSDGHPGMGGEDLYMSRRQNHGSWGTPVNLGYPINTSGNESSITVMANGKIALFASDREGGYGDLDLYSFELAEGFRPMRVTYLEGTVVDKGTGAPLPARFELIDLSTEQVVVESFANASDGSFLVSLPEGRDYALNVTQKGYLFHSENFSLAESTSNEPQHKRVELAPIKAGESVVLRNVFFETGSFDLSPTSRAELNKLVSFLNKNYRMRIELGGHTDNVGKADANKTLSQKRADAVRTFLIEKGIPEERLTTKGYGTEKPLASNDSEEGRAQNRRTEFTVLSNE